VIYLLFSCYNKKMGKKLLLIRSERLINTTTAKRIISGDIHEDAGSQIG